MSFSWAKAASVLLPGVAATLPATAVWADTIVAISPGNVPTTAESAMHMCEAGFGGGPFPSDDVWVFVLPDITRHFVSITAGFDSDGDNVVDARRTAPPDGGIADDRGTSTGWALAPAGWRLITGTAVVTGDPDPDLMFTLTRACPAGVPSPSPTPSPSRTTGSSPSASPTARPRASATPRRKPATGTPSPEARSPTPSRSASPVAGGGGGGATPMPSIGPEIAGKNTRLWAGRLLVGGGTLLAVIVGGCLLVIARRRRDFA